MAAPLLVLSDVHLSLGPLGLLQGAELTVEEGERLCLVGRNGSGKSTLLKVAAGLLEADRGERVVHRSATIRYLPQEPDLSGHATVLDYVAEGLGPSGALHRAEQWLAELGLSGSEAPGRLSGGEARRAALARTLAPEPDILLLDEPTNHLDLPAIEWLERTLLGLRSALVLISHDRRFLQVLSRRTVWLDRGRTRRLDRGFGAFEAWRDEQLELEELERHKLERKIAAEQDWLRYGVTARRKRNVRRLGNLMALREERRTQRRAPGSVVMTTGEGELSGKLVIEAKTVAKAWEGRPVVRDLSLLVRRGDRLGLVGPNGAGKTTILNLLTGTLQPDSGSVRLGANLQTVVLDQRRAALDPRQSLAEVLTGGRGDTVTVGGQSRHVMSYLRDFLFTPEQARTPAGVLSGGERGRLLLAKALAQPSNLLVLDEPTNDLDLETLDLLQEMLGDYPGTVIFVSHDRDFLDRVATSLLAAEGEGRWQEYAGGYSDLLAQRGHGVEAAVAPERAAKPKAAAEPRSAEPRGAAPQRRKLSFKDKHALETLPGRIEALQREILGLEAKLADAGLFARDPEAFAKTADRLAAAQAELAESEDRWLALEMLREELEG